MDAEAPHNTDKPSAKIIPFSSNSVLPSSESSPEPSAEAKLLEEISAAIDSSVWSKTRQEDMEALEDERAFHRRFGFTVNRERRKKVLDFKHVADLTDREIRLLWRTSNLDLTDSKAQITASDIAQTWGYIQIGAICLLMLSGFLAAILANDRSLSQMAALAAIEFVLVGILSGVDRLYVRPNQIRRRTIEK